MSSITRAAAPVTTLPRVGMFGGAFDPPHLAHVALARAAIEQLQLDRLYLFPTGDAWHRSEPILSSGHRLAMAKAAFGDVPHVIVDDAELRRPGPTYTVDTLEDLRRRHPGATLFLLLGADQAARLPTWHRHTDISELATVCVAARPGSCSPTLFKAGSFRRIEMPVMDISATEIRRRLMAGQDVSTLVPAEVARYIAEHQLYSRPG